MSLEAEVGYNLHQEMTLDDHETKKSTANLRNCTLRVSLVSVTSRHILDPIDLGILVQFLYAGIVRHLL